MFGTQSCVVAHTSHGLPNGKLLCLDGEVPLRNSPGDRGCFAACPSPKVRISQLIFCGLPPLSPPPFEPPLTGSAVLVGLPPALAIVTHSMDRTIIGWDYAKRWLHPPDRNAALLQAKLPNRRTPPDRRRRRTATCTPTLRGMLTKINKNRVCGVQMEAQPPPPGFVLQKPAMFLMSLCCFLSVLCVRHCAALALFCFVFH